LIQCSLDSYINIDMLEEKSKGKSKKENSIPNNYNKSISQ